MKGEKAVLVIILVIITASLAYGFNNYFLSTGVSPDIAAGYAVAIFTLVLCVFGLITDRARL